MAKVSSYADWLDVAKEAVAHFCELRGQEAEFREGAARAAALAALEQQNHGCGWEASISAIKDVLSEYRVRELA